MRTLLLLIALATAGCSKNTAEPKRDANGFTEAEAWYYQEDLKKGYTPAQAKAAILQIRNTMNLIENDPEIDKIEARRKQDLATLHESACRADPVMDGC